MYCPQVRVLKYLLHNWMKTLLFPFRVLLRQIVHCPLELLKMCSMSLTGAQNVPRPGDQRLQVVDI